MNIKKTSCIFLGLASIIFFNILAEDQVSSTNLFLIDKIEAVVFTQEGTKIVTKSDVDRPSLEGVPRSLDDHIFESLAYLEAKKFKMLPEPEDIDKHLSSVQRQNNLSLDDLKAIFSQAGYSYEEGREQFGRMYAVNSIIDFRIRSRLIVPEKDVQSYYNEHPEVVDESYQLQRAFVPLSSTKTKEALQEQIALFIKTGVGPLDIQWSEPFWIDKNDLAEAKKFITDMQINEVSTPQEIAGGFEFFRLVNKNEEHLRPFEDRYREIADILRQPKYVKLMEEFKHDLFKNASILYP